MGYSKTLEPNRSNGLSGLAWYHLCHSQAVPTASKLASCGIDITRNTPSPRRPRLPPGTTSPADHHFRDHSIILLRHSGEITILCSPKVTHHHGQLGGVLPPGKSVFLPHGNCCAGLALPPPSVGRFAGTRSLSCDLSALRAFGADDGKAPRTPLAWMISLVSLLALRQIVFLVWVSLTEQKWVILGERRSILGQQCGKPVARPGSPSRTSPFPMRGRRMPERE